MQEGLVPAPVFRPWHRHHSKHSLLQSVQKDTDHLLVAGKNQWSESGPDPYSSDKQPHHHWTQSQPEADHNAVPEAFLIFA